MYRVGSAEFLQSRRRRGSRHCPLPATPIVDRGKAKPGARNYSGGPCRWDARGICISAVGLLHAELAMQEWEERYGGLLFLRFDDWIRVADFEGGGVRG